MCIYVSGKLKNNFTDDVLSENGEIIKVAWVGFTEEKNSNQVSKTRKAYICQVYLEGLGAPGMGMSWKLIWRCKTRQVQNFKLFFSDEVWGIDINDKRLRSIGKKEIMEELISTVEKFLFHF